MNFIEVEGAQSATITAINQALLEVNVVANELGRCKDDYGPPRVLLDIIEDGNCLAQ